MCLLGLITPGIESYISYRHTTNSYSHTTNRILQIEICGRHLLCYDNYYYYVC
jgi:hypothetical protein